MTKKMEPHRYIDFSYSRGNIVLLKSCFSNLYVAKNPPDISGLNLYVSMCLKNVRY